jgi:hypothetical protein
LDVPPVVNDCSLSELKQMTDYVQQNWWDKSETIRSPSARIRSLSVQIRIPAAQIHDLSEPIRSMLRRTLTPAAIPRSSDQAETDAPRTSKNQKLVRICQVAVTTHPDGTSVGQGRGIRIPDATIRGHSVTDWPPFTPPWPPGIVTHQIG